MPGEQQPVADGAERAVLPFVIRNQLASAEAAPSIEHPCSHQECKTPCMSDSKRVTFSFSRRALAITLGVVILLVAAFLIGRGTSQRPQKASASSTTSTRASTSVRTSTPATTAVVTTTTTPPTTTTVLPAAPLPDFVAGSYTGRQPSQIDLAPACCNVVDHIAWSSWGSAQALGQGTWEYDTCASGCVNGPFVPYSASLALSGPLGGTFTVLTVDTTGPQGSFSSYSYPQTWPYGAS